MTRFAIAALVLAACGGSDSKTPDAGKTPDAAGAATVSAVTPCPATPDATVMTSGFAYSPMATTINMGQVVKFVMPAEHNVVPNTTMSDPGLMVNFSETKCLRFTQTGTFGFHCAPHGFTGTVTVN